MQSLVSQLSHKLDITAVEADPYFTPENAFGDSLEHNGNKVGWKRLKDLF